MTDAVRHAKVSVWVPWGTTGFTLCRMGGKFARRVEEITCKRCLRIRRNRKAAARQKQKIQERIYGT